MSDISQAIKNCIPADINDWIDASIHSNTPFDAEALINEALLLISGSPRKLKKLEISDQIDDEYAFLSLTDRIRINTILKIKDDISNEQTFFDIYQQIVKFCDDLEKTSLTKGICLIDPEGKLLESVIDLCRTNSTVLLSAIALNNDYPATFFPELNFNQMVLKALFCGIDIRYINQLEKRRNPELTRMSLDYKAELLAADRKVPDSLPEALE